MGFSFAPVVYAVIAWFVGSPAGRETGTPPTGMYWVLGPAVVGSAVFAWVVAPRFFGPARLLARGQAYANSPPVSESPAYARLPESERRLADAFGAVQASCIIRWAGIESLAIYPLIALFVGLVDPATVWVAEAVVFLLLLNSKPDIEAGFERL